VWVELVGPGELLTGLMKSVLKTTAGYKGNRCQLYCGERARWTQIETQRPDARYRAIMMLGVCAGRWRRMRDLNPRGAINPNTISNRAP
jgi:hypothetical protein